MRRLVGALLFLAGCYSPVGELVQSHVEPGGALTASLDAGPQVTIKGLADATGDPMVIDGNSAVLVVGMVVGNDDGSGMPAKAMLLANQAVTMTVGTTSVAQLSVHLNGQSCAATTALIHLTPDGNGNIDGDFAGSGAACQLGGTLSKIPIAK